MCDKPKCATLVATFPDDDPRAGFVRLPSHTFAIDGDKPTRVGFMIARLLKRIKAHLQLNDEQMKGDKRIARWHFLLEYLATTNADGNGRRAKFTWYVSGKHTDNKADRIKEHEVMSGAKANKAWAASQRRLGEEQVKDWTFVVPSVTDIVLTTNVIERRDLVIACDSFVPETSSSTASRADASMSTPGLTPPQKLVVGSAIRQIEATHEEQHAYHRSQYDNKSLEMSFELEAVRKQLAEANAVVEVERQKRKRSTEALERSEAKRRRLEEVTKDTIEQLKVSKHELLIAHERAAEVERVRVETEKQAVRLEAELSEAKQRACLAEKEASDACVRAAELAIEARNRANDAADTIARLQTDAQLTRKEAKTARKLAKELQVQKRRAVEIEKELKLTKKLLTEAREQMEALGVQSEGIFNNLMSDRWHKKKRNKGMSLHMFGFVTWQQAKIDADCSFPDELFIKKEIYEAAMADDDGSEEYKAALKRYKIARIHKLECILIAQLRIRRGFSLQVLVVLTGFGLTKVSEILKEWIPYFGFVGKVMCNFTVTEKFADHMAPQIWLDSPLHDCMLVGDGKDIAMDEIRSNSHVRDLAYSSKIKQAALRGMSWMLPCGLYCTVTDLVLAKTTEPALFKAYANQFHYVPSGRRLLYDKGLGDLRWATPNLTPISTPSFLKGRAVFGAEETGSNRHLAMLRYTVEVGYSRIYNFKFLQDRMPYCYGTYANEVWFYAHYRANKMQPLR
jgi:hypothetical protein